MSIKQSKICLTAFYFGQFNNYFELWLNSCRYNSTVDFILFTDNREPFNYPDNVKRILFTFNEFKAKCQKTFEFEISMKNPYHTCDYVPAFGDIFEKELASYDFWGHCDMDLIFGDIRHFVTEDILAKYDKISWRGHFSLYKNSPKIKRIYKTNWNQIDIYKVIFTNPSNSLFAFEENEINDILEKNGYKIYKGLRFADLKTCTNNFEMMHFSPSFQDKNKHQIFEFNKGKLIRHFVHEGIHKTDEMMYIHFLKRPMSIDNNFCNSDHFLIVPNRFIPFEEMNAKKIKKWNKKKFYFSYYWERLNWRYYMKRKKSIENIQRFEDEYSHLDRNEFTVIIDEYEGV